MQMVKSEKSDVGSVKLIAIDGCGNCPFGVLKNALSDKPVLVCMHPLLDMERVVPKATDIGLPIAPPRWCRLMDFEEMVLKNRLDAIKLIEKMYGPLSDTNLWKIKPKRKPKIYPWKTQGNDTVYDSWAKTYRKRYQTSQTQNSPLGYTTKGRYRGKPDPSYPSWLKSLKSKKKVKS